MVDSNNPNGGKVTCGSERRTRKQALMSEHFLRTMGVAGTSRDFTTTSSALAAGVADAFVEEKGDPSDAAIRSSDVGGGAGSAILESVA